MQGFFFYVQTNPARVVEQVDTQDLKSCDPKGRTGSIPVSGTFCYAPSHSAQRGFSLHLVDFSFL